MIIGTNNIKTRIIAAILLIAFIRVTAGYSQGSLNDGIVDSGVIKKSKNNLLNGVSKAICYSGYRSGQHPDRGKGAKNPSYQEIFEDLFLLSEKADFHLIRLYDCGENTEMVLKTIKKHSLNIKVMLGIWLRAELSNHETCSWLTDPIPEEKLNQNKILNLQEIDKGIELSATYRDIVIAVNVGNEALVEWNDHKVHPDTVVSYVKTVKSAVEQEVTVAENYRWWIDHGQNLSKEVDFVSIHTYPVWEGKDINEGLSYSIKNVQQVIQALPGVKFVISEAGWPSVASEFPDIASEENQLRYYSELMNWSEQMNITAFFFEAFDEDWKGNPDNMMGAEKHWGLFTVDRKPKKAVHYILSESKIKPEEGLY